jgi:thiosulfate/3-mercaptopyruvate sulfurtransferase
MASIRLHEAPAAPPAGERAPADPVAPSRDSSSTPPYCIGITHRFRRPLPLRYPAVRRAARPCTPPLGALHMTDLVPETDLLGRGYARPDVLASTAWVAEHLDDPGVRIVESNEDLLLYPSRHIPGAVQVDWAHDLNHPVVRDYVDRAGFERLLSSIGCTRDTTVVFYGDKNNWWACYAFWVFQLFGHANAKILNGGRKKWIDEGRPLSKEMPSYPATTYKAQERADYKIRAFRDQVLAHVQTAAPLVDVRSPKEYSGELLHMEAYPNEGALRGGHIPGAKSIPWAKAVNDDGTFKSVEDLKQLYEKENGFAPNQNIIAYCRIGERSSHTWFVLTYLLGYPNVRNYDGSWTEWGNLVGAPIEK